MNILNEILIGIAAALVLLAVIALFVLTLDNAHLRAALAAARTNVTACQITNDDFRQKALQQDRALAALNEAAKNREYANAADLKKAHALAARYRQQAASLLRSKTHGDVCRAANDLLDRYRAEVKP